MASTERLADRLRTWKQLAQNDTAHLAAAELYALTASGAMAQADPTALQHLSLCPRCLEEWANWRRARSAAEDTGAAADTHIEISYGFLQAAADGRQTAERLQSQCGRFCLNVLPQLDDPSRGMITLELLDERQVPLENARVTVHDRQGTCLLEGRLQNGRLARACTNLAEVDLSRWSIVIEQGAKH